MSHIAEERIDEFAKAFVAFLRRILAEKNKVNKSERSKNAK